MVAIREIDVRGMRYRVREAGTDGEPVLLLHGFPETSLMWEGLIAVLAAAGYRCMAPDQRGYSPGARPTDVAAYRYEDLAADIHAFAETLGPRVHLVGHDWGALAGWAALEVDASPFVSWTAMSCPHYGAFAQAIYDDPEEEFYRGLLDLFAREGEAETVLAGPVLRTFWNAHPPETIEAYAAHFDEPGALTAALNYYRASRNHRRAIEDFPIGPVATPTLMLWGATDPAVRRRSIDLAAPLMTGPYRLVELHAGHWIVEEAFEWVAEETLAHVRANPIA